MLNLGVDTNGNGVLDDDEVTGNEVVCNGRDGRDGQNSEAASGYHGALLGSYSINNDLDAHLIRGVTDSGATRIVRLMLATTKDGSAHGFK